MDVVIGKLTIPDPSEECPQSATLTAFPHDQIRGLSFVALGDTGSEGWSDVAFDDLMLPGLRAKQNGR